MAGTSRIHLTRDDFDFHHTISKTFGSIREENYLCDLTLITDDNKQVSAHKLVLSACSDYFKNIFKRNANVPHLVICLDMVDSDTLTHLLDYMYNGEVSMEEENLNSFLHVGARFKIKGLRPEDPRPKNISKTGNVGDFCEISLGENDQMDSSGAVPSIKEEPGEEPEEEPEEEDSNGWSNSQSNEQINSNTPFSLDKKICINQVSFHENIKNIKSKDEKELDEFIEQLIIRRPYDKIKFECKLCGKTAKLSRNLKNHIETHMEGLEFQCKHCEKKCRTRVMLAMHVSKYHKQKGVNSSSLEGIPEGILRLQNPVPNDHIKIEEPLEITPLAGMNPLSILP